MFASVAFAFIMAAIADQPLEPDIILRGATLHDGTGRGGVKGDLAIRGDRIVGIGKFEFRGQPRIIDAQGLVVAPGFIDLHTHSDEEILQDATRANLNYLMQGVTTIVTGNCGFGPHDVADYYRKIEARKAGTNVIHQIPHGNLRSHVMKGSFQRPPSAEELAQMKELVDQGMQAGAWGFCTGLIYTPSSYATTEELIALASVAARHGGFYASHVRGEGATLLPAITEAIQIGKQAGLPVHVSHLKASGRQHWGKAADAIALIARARAEGQVVTADQYPYAASSTSLMATLVPTRFREGSNADFLQRLDDPARGPALRQAIQDEIKAHDDGKSVRIASYAKNRSWQGKDLAAIAAAEGRPVLDVVLEILRNGGAAIVNFGMSEENVRLIMKQPWVATASDGSAKVPNETVPHPRSYGCFPRKIGRYCLEEQVLPLEQAIRSASGLPADVLRLKERGYLRVGYVADVAAFDPAAFRDTATYEQPHQYAPGVRYLFVNGVATIDDGKYVNALAGKVLRRQDHTRSPVE